MDGWKKLKAHVHTEYPGKQSPSPYPQRRNTDLDVECHERIPSRIEHELGNLLCRLHIRHRRVNLRNDFLYLLSEGFEQKFELDVIVGCARSTESRRGQVHFG